MKRFLDREGSQFLGYIFGLIVLAVIAYVSWQIHWGLMVAPMVLFLASLSTIHIWYQAITEHKKLDDSAWAEQQRLFREIDQGIGGSTIT